MQTEQLSKLSSCPIITYLRIPTYEAFNHTKQRSALFALKGSVRYRRNYEPYGRPWLLVLPRYLQGDIVLEATMT